MLLKPTVLLLHTLQFIGLVTLLIHDTAAVRAKEHTREQTYFIIAVWTLALFA